MQDLNDYLQVKYAKHINFSINDLFHEVCIDKESSSAVAFYAHIRKTLLLRQDHTIPQFVSLRKGRLVIVTFLALDGI